MRTSQPEKLLKLILPSLQTQHADLGIVLSRTAFRISFVKRTAGELHYKIDVVVTDNPSTSLPTESVVKSKLLKVSYSNDVDNMYSTLASFISQAIPLLVIEQEGFKHKCDIDIVLADVYILEHKEN